SQVVGNAVRYVTDPLHEVHNPVQHLVEVLCQLIKVIIGATGWYAVRQVAAHDAPGGVVDDFNASGGTAAHQESAQQGKPQGNAHTPVDGALDDFFKTGKLVNIPAHQQMQPALNFKDARP